MPPASQHSIPDHNRHEVRRVLLVTLALNLAVAVGKIGMGLVTGALAITADGFHSLMDGSSNVVGLIANHLAARPPDAEHPYGHRRYETLAALMIGTFLLLTAWEIARSAIERLRLDSRPNLTPLAFVVMLGTLAVNIGVSRWQMRAGRRLKSELLLADAANTSSDVFVTASVLTSMGLVALLNWTWVDLAAALVVVALIARAAWKVLRQTGGVLVDTAPYTPAQLETIVRRVPSVEQVIRARSRGPADAAHIDIDVQVAPETTASHSAAIAGAIRDQLTHELGSVAEVEVHFTPHENSHQNIPLTVRASADALGLATHEVILRDCDGRQTLELHVEVPPGQTLDSAHEQVSRLEDDLHARLDSIDEIVTHIEPASYGPNEEDRRLLSNQEAHIKRQALRLLRARYPAVDWHHLRVFEQGANMMLTMHAGLAADVSIEFAHSIAEQAETLLRSELPQLTRVTIHTEPTAQ